MKLEDMKPNQDCYDRIGRKLTFIAPVGERALVQSWHLEESLWTENGHEMGAVEAHEGPIWLEDPAKLYDKPPVEVVDKDVRLLRQELDAARADLEQKKRDLAVKRREAEAKLRAEQDRCDRAVKALVLRGVDVEAFIAGEFKFAVESFGSRDNFCEPQLMKLRNWHAPFLKIDSSGQCDFCIRSDMRDKAVELFRTEEEAKARVCLIIAEALAKPFRSFTYGRDRLWEAADKWGVPVPQEWADAKAEAEQRTRERERQELEAKLQKLSGGA